MFWKCFLIPVFIGVFFGCRDKYTPVFNDTIVVDKNYKAHEDTVLMDSLPPILYSRLNVPNTFGLRTHFELPETSQGKDMYVIVSGRSRNNYAHSFGAIAISSYSEKREQLSWDLIKMRFQYTGVNEWCDFRDSLKLPPNFYGTQYNLINVTAHLPQGSENFDLDGLKVVISQKD